jgi:hypothetical protein
MYTIQLCDSGSLITIVQEDVRLIADGNKVLQFCRGNSVRAVTSLVDEGRKAKRRDVIELWVINFTHGVAIERRENHLFVIELGWNRIKL